MYDNILRDIERHVEGSDIFELFDYLKKLAVIQKSLILLGDSTLMVDGLIERVQEQIVMIKIEE